MNGLKAGQQIGSVDSTRKTRRRLFCWFIAKRTPTLWMNIVMLMGTPNRAGDHFL